ncbi:hypothetical protein, partial [Tenacibaculum maritimum]|uniref:hypothetical protein n=1 Tax=Tenacibaculum maritimum TaxID=107401 RepID=UPI001330C757
MDLNNAVGPIAPPIAPDMAPPNIDIPKFPQFHCPVIAAFIIYPIAPAVAPIKAPINTAVMNSSPLGSVNFKGLFHTYPKRLKYWLLKGYCGLISLFITLS